MTWRRAALIACSLFVVACAAEFGGLFSHSFPGDTATYAKYGRALVNDGHIPYTKGFYDEYPPGSVPVFAAPALIWDAHYVLVFKLLMTACGVGFVACAAWIAGRLGLSYVRLTPAVLAPRADGARVPQSLRPVSCASDLARARRAAERTRADDGRPARRRHRS